MNISIQKKRIKLDEIIIPEDFKVTKPREEKFIRYYHNYREHNNINNDIVLNENSVLEDGYISYLIYKMFNIEFVDVYVNYVQYTKKRSSVS